MAQGYFMFNFALFAKQLFGFYSASTWIRFEHVYRCSPPMQLHHAKRLEKAAGRAQVCASCLRKLTSDGAGQWFDLVRYCSQAFRDHAEICLFHFTSFGWSQMLAKINEGDVYFHFFQCQGKPAFTMVPLC